MKKLFLLAMIIAVVNSTSYAATLQRTILSHKGNLTQYDANHWQEAFDNAVAGDTVFFTPGNFVGILTITKPITLIGAGMSENDVFWKDTDLATAYAGCATTSESTFLDYVIIDIPGSLTLKSTLMEGFRINSVTINQPVTNLSIKRCQICFHNGWELIGEINASEPVTNLQLEDCYVLYGNFANFVNPDIHNCFFGSIGNTPEETEFTNCTIQDIWGTSNCSFINCIVHFASGSNNTCVNCIHDDAVGDQTTYVNSWHVGGAAGFTKSQLQSGGYIGNDDTVVGPLGGTAPFTLIPSQPYVSSSTLTYNKTTKKLSVNVTVKKGQ
ncbi:MAG: hypothetical protein IK075_06700 [Prevotella sp.]|nr:hypothetical protein [Prevotella sp.]